VLYETQDPVNIGGVVRAMKNMGAQDLRLVRPVPYDVTRILQIAHDTRDIVERIRHYDDLDDALADCVKVIAFSGRRRATRWAMHTPRSMVEDVFEAAADGPVALLFGREDHGLPSAAIDRAHALVTIPTTEHFSLNIAQAVLVGLYELHVAAGDATRRLGRPRKATPPPLAADAERTFADVEAALHAIAYFRTRNPELIMRSIRSLVFRAAPDSRELTMLRTTSIEVLRTIAREKRALLRALGIDEGSLPEALRPDVLLTAPTAPSAIASPPTVSSASAVAETTASAIASAPAGEDPLA
jgi:tRNA/rRNA methyltransferase/tRNA (cytidine32/uridine32-2'-O)-methyltransferase